MYKEIIARGTTNPGYGVHISKYLHPEDPLALVTNLRTFTFLCFNVKIDIVLDLSEEMFWEAT